MPHRTLKRRLFVSEPMGDKKVDQLPGIGKALRRNLEDNGYSQAKSLLAEFIRQDSNIGSFTKRLKVVSGANSKQAKLCAECLKEWCDNNL